MKVERTIEIDCPPGFPRPSDLLPEVLEGTGLEVKEPVSTIFGCFTWVYEVESDEAWEEVQKIIAPRLRELHEMGIVRYCSW